MIYFIFKKSSSICHIIQQHFQQLPIDLEFHFKNYKHLLKYFQLYIMTTVNKKKQYQEFLFICLFTKLQRQKQIFIFRNSVGKPQDVLFKNKPFSWENSNIDFQPKIPLYIGKNLLEKLCKVLEMQLKTYTQVSLKFVFEKIEFKVLFYKALYST